MTSQPDFSSYPGPYIIKGIYPDSQAASQGLGEFSANYDPPQYCLSWVGNVCTNSQPVCMQVHPNVWRGDWVAHRLSEFTNPVCSGNYTTEYFFVYPAASSVCACPTQMISDTNPVPEGGSANLHLEPPVQGISFNWSITATTGTAKGIVSGSGLSAALSDVSGEGSITIKAEDPNDPSCSITGTVKVGSCGCAKQCTPGKGNFVISSIDAEFSLGKGENGMNLGAIRLAAETPDPANSTPNILAVDFIGDVEILDDAGVVSQVVTPQTFIDVEVISAYEYNLHYYDKSAMGAQVGGFYEVLPGAESFVTWNVQNPNGAASNDVLRITELKGSSSIAYEYSWDGVFQEWTLSKGNGLEVVSKTETINGNERTTREITKDGQGNTISDVATTYRAIACNSGSTEVEVQKIEDPDGLALTTTITPYEDVAAPECGKVQSKENPDGSWVKYEYDAQARLFIETSSWLDVQITAPSSMASGRL